MFQINSIKCASLAFIIVLILSINKSTHSDKVDNECESKFDDLLETIKRY